MQARNWDQFIEFLVDDSTPFSPYFDFVYLISKYILLSLIAKRLTYDSNRYRYLEAKRSEGRLELVKRLTQAIIKKFGLDHLEKEISYIYTDVLHLSGKYQEAVQLDDEY